MKTYRNHRGVKIYRLEEYIPDYKEIQSTGKWVHSPSTSITIIRYGYASGPPCNTLEEVKEMIDELLKQADERGIPQQMMIDELNSQEEFGNHWGSCDNPRKDRY